MKAISEMFAGTRHVWLIGNTCLVHSYLKQNKTCYC